jgi:Leucine-rich repeat (LRR) protein
MELNLIKLPKDILNLIMLELSLHDLLNLLITNKRLYEISKSKYFWRNKLNKDFPFFLREKYDCKENKEQDFKYYYIIFSKLGDLISNIKDEPFDKIEDEKIKKQEYGKRLNEIFQMCQIDFSGHNTLKDYKIYKGNEISPLFHFPNLTRLTISYLQIKELNIFPFRKEFKDNKVMTSLNLYMNGIKYICPSIQYLINLNILNLHNNQLEFLPKEMGYLKRLKYLILSHNMIQELPETFCQLESLEFLFSENNKLTQIPNLLNLPKIQNVYFNNNLITSLKNISQISSSLLVADFTGNPINKETLPLELFGNIRITL